MYKSIIRKILFKFDPEKIHYKTASIIKFIFRIPGVKNISDKMYRVKNKELERNLFGLNFENPVGLAAGFDKNASMFNDLANFGFGFIEIGTITPKGQPGNEKPRLFRLKEKGVTLLITTHHMDEAEQLCDRLMVMDKGEIMAEGSPAELIKKYSTKEVLEVRFGSDRNSQMVEKLQSFAERLEELPDRLLLYIESGEDLLAKIVAANIHPNTSLVRRSSLEDVFLRLTGRSLIE